MQNCVKDDGKNKKHPIILCGDFNIVGGGAEYNAQLAGLTINGRKLDDVWLKLGKKETPSKNAATWVGNDKDAKDTPWGKKNVLAMEKGDFQRLDYMFVFKGSKAAPLELKAKSINREPEKARDKPYKWITRRGKIESYTLSDHLGIKSTFIAIIK